MDYSDVDQPEFFKAEWRTARKAWTCHGCKKERPSGVRYQYILCKMPGEPFDASKHCIIDPNGNCPFDREGGTQTGF